RERGQQPAAAVGQAHPPLLAHEQRPTEPILELADLVADCGLSHAQLLGGAREVLVPARGLECADRRERRKAFHPIFIRLPYQFQQPFCWRFRAGKRICAASNEGERPCKTHNSSTSGRTSTRPSPAASGECSTASTGSSRRVPIVSMLS